MKMKNQNKNLNINNAVKQDLVYNQTMTDLGNEFLAKREREKLLSFFKFIKICKICKKRYGIDRQSKAECGICVRCLKEKRIEYNHKMKGGI